ncbi:MAG: hypothetical protein OTJ97_04680, partial [SAR202 cluster bacterium]|nr:hypothetical protein [SAR202 cluster bacterium]
MAQVKMGAEVCKGSVPTVAGVFELSAREAIKKSEFAARMGCDFVQVAPPHRFERPTAPNGVLFGWDAGNEEFVHYHRNTGRVRADVDGIFVRTKSAVMRTSSGDFETWGGTHEVLTRGKDDPPGWSSSHGIDLAGVHLTDDLYIGFVDGGTRHFVKDVPPDAWEGVRSKEFAEYWTELMVSRDGQNRDRVAPMW